MKQQLLIPALLLLLLIPGATTTAQPVTAIETLSVDLWPDYDQEAVLVLLTGTLAQPGTVTLPFPAAADFHVLARIDAAGSMIDDLEAPTFANGQMTFTTPDLRFRVEYYLPYTRTGNQRSFTYTWPGSVPVNQMLVSVQQPASATGMTITPEPAGEVRNQDDGLLYYNLPAQTVAAGETAVFQVEYTMSRDVLTVAAGAPAGGNNDAAESAVSGSEDTPTWVLALVGAGLLLIVAAITWQITTHNGRRVRKPKPRRTAKRKPASKKRAGKRPSVSKKAAKFCHECGSAADSGDRFCRNCGTVLKR